MTSPVTMFSLPGLNENLNKNNSGFDSPPQNDESKMAAYKIPPVVWMILFLVGGYLIVRYALEES